MATVVVKLIKISGNKQIVLGTKTFINMQLRHIPSACNAINSKFTMPAVLSSKDKIYINYSIEYNSNGSIVTLCNQLQEATKRNTRLQIVI